MERLSYQMEVILFQKEINHLQQKTAILIQEYQNLKKGTNLSFFLGKAYKLNQLEKITKMLEQLLNEICFLKRMKQFAMNIEKEQTYLNLSLCYQEFKAMKHPSFSNEIYQRLERLFYEFQLERIMCLSDEVNNYQLKKAIVINNKIAVHQS